jgi:hypothetical protein
MTLATLTRKRQDRKDRFQQFPIIASCVICRGNVFIVHCLATAMSTGLLFWYFGYHVTIFYNKQVGGDIFIVEGTLSVYFMTREGWIAELLHDSKLTDFKSFCFNQYFCKLNCRELEGGSPRGGRWKKNIEVSLKRIGYRDIDWNNLVQCRILWRSVVNTVMNLWVPKKNWESLYFVGL